MKELKYLRNAFNDEILVKFNYSLLEDLATDAESDYFDYFTTKEVLELWGITEWLAKKLIKRDEICFNYHGLWIWGRTCSGQSIYLDSVFSDIFDVM